MVRDPKLVVPDDQQILKYEPRSVDKLRTDVYNMTQRMATFEKEKTRQDIKYREQGDRLRRHMAYVWALLAIDLIIFLAWILK
jgi:hypothetical protein